MDKVAAIITLIGDVRREKASRTSMLRAERALRALGLNDEDLKRMMVYLDYWMVTTGKPWPHYEGKK